MIAASCPRCAESIRVPTASLPDDAYAQCPLCRETFSINELTDRLPPAVQVFGADGEPIDVVESSPAMVVSQADGLSGGYGAAALATGAAALGTASIGHSSDIESGDIESGDIDLSDEHDEMGSLDELSDEQTVGDEDDIESEVEDYLDDAAAVESATSADHPDPESTLLMDTMQMESAEVDVDDEVGQFSGAETVVEGTGTIEFESDGIDHDAGMVVEEVDLGEELEQSASAAETMNLPPVAAQLVRSGPSRRGRRAKKASPLKLIFGVLLGPLLALPLAGGILLAIGKAPDLGFWPFLGNANAINSRVAAWPAGSSQSAPMPDQSKGFGENGPLLPADSDVGEFVRENASEMVVPPGDDDVNSNADLDTAVKADSVAPSIALPPMTKDDTETSDQEAAQSAAALLKEKELAAKKRLEARRKESSEQSADTIFKTPVPIAEPVEKGTADGSAPDLSFPEPAKETSAQPEMLRGLEVNDQSDAPFGHGVALTGPASSESPEVAQSAVKVTDSMVELATRRASGTAKDQDLARTYREICLFAELMPDLSSTSTHKLMREISESSFLDEFESKLISQWMGYAKRPTEGVLLIGVIEGTPEATQLKLTTGDSIAISLSSGNPVGAFGSRVVAIGKIVGDNTVELSSAVAVPR